MACVVVPGTVKLLAVPVVALVLCGLVGVDGGQRFVVLAFAAQVSVVTTAGLLTLSL